MQMIERCPVALANAVLKGLRVELAQKGELATLEAGSHVDEPDVWQTHPEYYESIYDANSGTKLDADLVAQGRHAEMDFLQKDLGAWSYDKIENCVQETGKQPIPMTWVDINKGDDMRPNVRCRLCVQETRRRSPMDIVDTFSATPPYEALRLMVSMTMTPRNDQEANHVLLFVVITRAHPHC